MTAVDVYTGPVIRPQVGLMLSIGEPPIEGRNYPKKLDHFRPKPGAELQYALEAAKFTEMYGDEPKSVDVVFISNQPGEVLDLRLKAWGTSGLRAIGNTNYAEHPERLWHDGRFDCRYDDILTAFPEDRPDSIEYQLKGADDPIIDRVGLKLYGVLRFAIPTVTGLTTLAEISTTSKRTMANWAAGIYQVLKLTNGQLAGVPMVLAVRPARTRFFDEKKKKRSTSTFYEVVLKTPHTWDEFAAIVQTRRAEMGAGERPRLELPPVRHDDIDRDAELFARDETAVERVANRQPEGDQQQQVRDEPAPDRADDSRLNRIARLEAEVGQRESEVVLRGVFGVDAATGLGDADAERYEQMLLKVATADAEDAGEPEVVDDGALDDEQGSVFERMAAEAQAARGAT